MFKLTYTEWTEREASFTFRRGVVSSSSGRRRLPPDVEIPSQVVETILEIWSSHARRSSGCSRPHVMGRAPPTSDKRNIVSAVEGLGTDHEGALLRPDGDMRLPEPASLLPTALTTLLSF